MKTLVTAALLATALATPALAEGTARTSAVLTIYSGPGEGYRPLGKVAKNVELELVRCTSGDWCLIRDQFGDPAGWVRASYLVGLGAITAARPFRFLVEPDLIPRPRP